MFNVATANTAANRRTRNRERVLTRKQQSLRDRASAIPFLLPAVGFVGVILLIPFVYTIVRSFYGRGDYGFVGLDNYVQMFTDPYLQHSLLNTLIWTLGALVLPVGLGLLLAVITHSMKAGAWIRAVILIPCAIAGTVAGVVGSMMFSSGGVINQILTNVGLIDKPIPWLLVWPLNIISAILLATWAGTGSAMVLFLVGLQTIPQETIQAAQIDGANSWQRFFYIVVPQLKATLAIVIGLSITNALRSFDLIYVLTAGGPNRSSETLALSMYRESFLSQDPAVGSAIAVVLTVIVVACSWIYLRKQIGSES